MQAKYEQSLKEQLLENGFNEDSKIVCLVSCGAGGPIGIGACMKNIYHHKNINFVIVQTDDQDALIRSLQKKTIQYNGKLNNKYGFNYVDGIAVNKPEKEAVKNSKKIVVD